MLQGVESTDNNLTSVKNEKNYVEGLQQTELRMMQGKYMKNNNDSTGKINKFNGELLCFLTESPFRILRVSVKKFHRVYIGREISRDVVLNITKVLLLKKKKSIDAIMINTS